jgi:hypothetical protein
MNQEEFNKLKETIGEEAAVRLERSMDAGLKGMSSKGTVGDLVTNMAEGALGGIHMVAHIASAVGQAIGGDSTQLHNVEAGFGEAWGRVADNARQNIAHVTGHDKPLDTPPSAQELQVKAK